VSQAEPAVVIAIRPEPSPEELAAITAAVTAALRLRATTQPADGPPAGSRWARQGRTEAMQRLGTMNDERQGPSW